MASQDDLIELLTSGVIVEDASAAEDDTQSQPSRKRRPTQPTEAQQETERDPRVPDMFDAAAAPEAPTAVPASTEGDQAAAAAEAVPTDVEEVAAEQPGEIQPVPAITSAAAPARPAPMPPTVEAVAADAPANTASAPSPDAASAAAEPPGSTAADDLRDQVMVLGTRLGTERPDLRVDVLPLELLTLCGEENPRLGDVLSWQHVGLERVFWNAYYEACKAHPAEHAPGHAEPQSTRQGRVPVKYRDQATGSTWTGRGLKPKWIQAALDAGRTLSDFEVKES